MGNSRALILALIIVSVGACASTPNGRQPPDEIRGDMTGIISENFNCGPYPAEEVWYPPIQAIVVGSDAIAAPLTAHRCPRSWGSGSFDLQMVAAVGGTVDVFIRGGGGEHGIAEAVATLFRPSQPPRTGPIVELEPNWYQVEVPTDSAEWLVRLDVVTELDWEASYAFVVTATE
ncbi:MAG: hypothetical protein GY720_11695 [bacterium]|nr:hypothetical protein [bacterium]